MKAYILSLNKEANLAEQWDYGFLHDFLTGDLWKTYNWQDFDIQSVSKLPKDDRAIVAIPARHHKDLVNKLNKELSNIKRVVLFLMGDEEAEFPVDKLDHDNIVIWVQNPHIGVHDNYFKIGTGYPKHFKDEKPKDMPNKNLAIFFSGQVTHDRRKELAEAIELSRYTYEFHASEGFTQGYSPEDYYQKMAHAFYAPCPSGAVIPDSFRLFEALELMCVPIADQVTPDGTAMEYWDWLFGSITPFPKITNWFAMNDVIADNQYDDIIEKQTQWWISYKRWFAYTVMEQLYAD